jgi:glycosyltransferase involved in cell wall biosynthesis
MLRAALDSLLAQTYAHLEILVQDDSTNDGCGQVVRELNDPRIHYTRNQPALGTVSNLRAGYRKATGKYFSTLNDDDLYTPTYIQTMVESLEADPRYSMAFCDHTIIDQDGVIDEATTNTNSITFGRNRLTEGSVPDPVVAGILAKSVPGMFAMFRREAMDLNDFPDEVSSGYDYWMTYLAVRAGNPIYYTPQRLTSYRVHAGSQTSSFTNPREALRSLRYSEYMHTRFLADPGLRSIHSQLRLRLAEIYASTGIAHLRLGDRTAARQQFSASLRTKFTTRALTGMTLTAAPTSLVKKLLAA